jgi:putative membrane protein insertion efficiency factor
MADVPPLPTRVVLALLSGYKYLLSPYFSGTCRYVPGCADFMKEAVIRHGVLKGGWYGLRRLSRCHALGGSGYDPVPHQ